MKELEEITTKRITSSEGKALNDYFFNNPEFVKKFRNGIGGLSQHHNYRGGLAEHTLNVTYLAGVLAARYESRYEEIAVLGAKLHDIGKVVEYDTNGPFSVTMRGDMEGHIVIGITMLEEAFREGGDRYSDDFKNRIKSCIVQHHGKLEFGSPKTPSTEEAYIVHFADYLDATLNKIGQVKEITEPSTWSEYDRRLGTRLYL
jgi:3'-5' exoribonuclease